MRRAISVVAFVILLFTFTSPITFAQQASERILHFPANYSLGTINIRDEAIKRKIETFQFWVDGAQDKWEYIGAAMGDVHIPAGKIVSLTINPYTYQQPQLLAGLKSLGPDDIYSLAMSYSPPMPGTPVPDDKCMPYIAHLTGLKELKLNGANVTNKGLKFLSEMKSLEQIYPPKLITGSGLATLAKIKTLKAIYFKENLVSDDSLKILCEFENLEELSLGGKRMTNEGLKHLASLPKLQYLLLENSFTDDGMKYLKDIPNLKILNIFSPKFTDEGLKHISEIKTLENLSVHWIDQITNDGIVHLTKMPNLKKLDIGHAKLTDKGCELFKQMKAIEYLCLPNVGLTDEGVAKICEIDNLQYLWVDAASNSPLTDRSLENISRLKNLKELCIGGGGFTDEGLENITKLKNLKQFWFAHAPEVTNDGLKYIGELTNLKNLSLPQRWKVTIAGLKALNNLTNLECLNIHSARQDNSVMDISGLKNLKDFTIILNVARTERDSFQDKDLACLSNLTRLDRLQLCSPGISNEGLKCLSGLTNLTYLFIADSEITDEGLRYVANMQHLWRLYIQGGHFTNAGLTNLYGLKNLNWLEITTDKPVSQQAIAALKQNLSNLETINIQTKRPPSPKS